MNEATATYGQWLVHAAFMQITVLHETYHHAMQRAAIIATNAVNFAMGTGQEPQLVAPQGKNLPYDQSPAKYMPHPKGEAITGESGSFFETHCFSGQACSMLKVSEHDPNRHHAVRQHWESTLKRCVWHVLTWSSCLLLSFCCR